MKYTVIAADNLEEFIRRVNEKIEEGWKLLGGHATMVLHSAVHGETFYFSQSMVNEKTTEAQEV